MISCAIKNNLLFERVSHEISKAFNAFQYEFEIRCESYFSLFICGTDISRKSRGEERIEKSVIPSMGFVFVVNN